jgi:hypothetical protein
MRGRYVISGLFVALLAIAFACGGKVLTPVCDPGWHYCGYVADVCCRNDYVCGTTRNGCALYSCCPLGSAPPGVGADEY